MDNLTDFSSFQTPRLPSYPAVGAAVRVPRWFNAAWHVGLGLACVGLFAVAAFSAPLV